MKTIGLLVVVGFLAFFTSQASVVLAQKIGRVSDLTQPESGISQNNDQQINQLQTVQNDSNVATTVGEPSDSVESTDSAGTTGLDATPSAQSAQPREDITLPPQTSRDDAPPTTVRSGLSVTALELPSEFSVLHPVRWAVRQAVENGVPANILVLLILFPMTAALVAMFRHIIGLEGFGIYTPAAMAIAFVSMGFTRGMFLFAVVLVATTIGKAWVQTLKLQYLPRASLVLWFVSLVVLGVMAFSPIIPIQDLQAVGIFPLLILVLLGEQFMAVQGNLNSRRAIEMTVETVLLASISAIILRTFQVQVFVLRFPELALLVTLGVNLLVGKYTGLRLTEMFRFRAILDQEE